MPSNPTIGSYLIGPAFSGTTIKNFTDALLPGIAAAGIPDMHVDAFEPKLKKELGTRLRTGGMREPAEFDDTLYYLPVRAEVNRIIAYLDQGVAVGEFKPASLKQIFDCEDFAYLTKVLFSLHRLQSRPTNTFTALAAGIIWAENFPEAGSLHACNLVFTSDEGILLVDPMPGAHRKVVPLDKVNPGLLIHHLVI